MLLKIEHLKKIYGEVEVLKGVSLSLEQGEHLAIEGSSGSGKSTLLYCLGMLENASSGKIYFSNQDITLLSDKEQAKFRNQNIGFIFQFHFLLPSMNCMDNIMLPSHLGTKSKKGVKEFVSKYAEILKVDHCLKKYPFEISGGEKQRINILRAISQRPDLLLCDEPTGNLDRKNTENVMHTLMNLAKEISASLIVVTHDSKVSSYFERKITIEDGQIIS